MFLVSVKFLVSPTLNVHVGGIVEARNLPTAPTIPLRAIVNAMRAILDLLQTVRKLSL